MDIALLSMGMSQIQVKQQLSIAVMKQSMDYVEQQGNAVQSLLEFTDIAKLQQTVQPHLGSMIDMKL
ncbi:YjfB family protein [Bacillus sp. JCM 19034]|uniref:YjfB family protein n=1 Tax=Bacillus sp. JCM 19034 TaxID=1481928 RepID=UPI000783BE65|nr:YjfB family protein [Bacillus sp. JCM 19034]